MGEDTAALAALRESPWGFDVLDTLRRLERREPERPRIGEGASLRDDYVRLGQDPFLDFPASNLQRFEALGQDRFRLLVKFLGLMGPQGALPLATTEEALGWIDEQGDDAFARFLDLLNGRFLQLFFRAWADARPIAQHDRPAADRFESYVGSTMGLGTAAFRDLDAVPDAGKLNFAGLIGPQTKSASRLRSLVRGLFGVSVEIEEFAETRLEMERGERTRIGAANTRLGEDMILGASCFSVEDKFRIRLIVRDLEQYRRFLPGGDRCGPLVDLIVFTIGEALDWEVELALPSAEVLPMLLGGRGDDGGSRGPRDMPNAEALSARSRGFGQIGWTTWLAPNWATSESHRCDARFNPAEQARHRREQAAATRPGERA